MTFRSIVGLLVLLGAWGSEARAQTDPMWRSPWTVSIGTGAFPLAVSTFHCGEGDSTVTTVAPCSDDTAWSSGLTVDLSVLFTVWRSPTDRWSFELGPQGTIRLLLPGGSWFVKGDFYSTTLQYTGGAVFGVRARPDAPPVPGSGKGSFEYGFRVGSEFGPGFAGLYAAVSGEVWTGWSLPRRWRPESMAGPGPDRRTSAVLGPYVRGSVAGNPAHAPGSYTTTHVELDVGIRIDIRREKAMPQPPQD